MNAIQIFSSLQRIKVSIFIFVVLLAIGLFNITKTYACEISTYPPTNYFSFGTITVSSSTPVNSVIATAHTYGQGGEIGPCYESTVYTRTYMVGSYASLYSGNIYKTNLTGIGIRLTDGNRVVPTSGSFPGPVMIVNDRVGTAELIKIGDVVGGNLLTGVIAATSDNNVEMAYYGISSGTIVSPSCSVVTPSVNVFLGEHLNTEFTGVGYKSEIIPVPVVLNCTTGARINATVVADADTTVSDAGSIKLTSGSGSADGLSVQLLDKNGTGVNLNQKFVVDTISANGQYSFNWSARYIQTKSTVTTGDANATASLQLTYE